MGSKKYLSSVILYNFMFEFEARIKKWGNSFGIILPKNIVEKENLSEDDKITLVGTGIDRKRAAQKLWGMSGRKKVDSEKLEKIADKEFDIS
jgi:antitoxin component of MazEF toxin-antitoxin module